MQKLERNLTIFVCALIAIAVVLGAAALALNGRQQQKPSPSATQPPVTVRPPPDQDRGLAIQPGQHVGPYEAWPVSFPKMLPGFFMLDVQAPQLALSHQQAKQILPLVEEMAEQWAIVHTVEIKIKQQLTPAQREWITKLKHQVEQGEYISRVVNALGSVQPGENASIVMAERICDKRAPSPVPPALAKAGEDERKRVLPPQDYMQGPNEEWLTVFDECTAFYWIDEDHPDMRMAGVQAVKIRAILKDVEKPLKIVEDDFRKVCAILRPEQITYVQEHMNDLYEYRTGKRKTKSGEVLTFTENPLNAEGDKYHDPLFFQTLVYLRAVAKDE